MKTIVKSILVISFISIQFLGFRSFAQSNPGFVFNVTQLPQPTLNFMDTVWVKKYHFQLSDTLNVKKLNIKMGTTQGGGEVVNTSIDFDPAVPLPIGYNYVRDSTSITLSIGAYSMGYYYYEASITDTSDVTQTVQQLNSSIHY